MQSLFLSACVYTLSVFAVGFVLGALRVLYLAPHVGEMTAVAMEMPLMLLASFLVAGAVVRRWQLERRLQPRLLMGALAFALLMLLETALSLTLFGHSLAQHLAAYARPVAWLGLAGQMIFAAMPALCLASERD